MHTLPTFLHFHNKTGKTIDIILPGSSAGIDSSLMRKIFEHSQNESHSVVAFNYPYVERGDTKYSGDDFPEELEALEMVMNYVQADAYDHIRFIGKSLGGVIASGCLETVDGEKIQKYEMVILGYVKGYVHLREFPGKITIIQGEFDPYGNIEEIKSDMKNALSKDITYHQIPSADHSYRDIQTKEPSHEDQAVAVIG